MSADNERAKALLERIEKRSQLKIGIKLTPEETTLLAGILLTITRHNNLLVSQVKVLKQGLEAKRLLSSETEPGRRSLRSLFRKPSEPEEPSSAR